ncbi:MAG TPA: hypothetical protein PLY32_06300 [Salinivirgaceae bacterium]|nr:hypothetical protein [Salinivirgaceae bacterium]HQA76716.1 hypothetical protein [Salinivirgaceae bacterium]
MLQEPKKYTDTDHFFFYAENFLEEVCNAPKDKDGVFKILELRDGEVDLVYVGYSNSGGLYNEIVEGIHYDNNPRKLAWTYQLLRDGTDALDIYWYSINGKGNQKKAQVEMLRNFVAIRGELPKWNK